jgi:hypothetical protein
MASAFQAANLLLMPSGIRRSRLGYHPTCRSFRLTGGLPGVIGTPFEIGSGADPLGPPIRETPSELSQ